MASNSKATIHQFKIELLDSEPSIWRQVQVPSTFDMFELHAALNDAMGWADYHFHVFKLLNLKNKRTEFIGRPITLENWKKGPVDSRAVPMTDYFMKPGDTAEYWYDFGDRWEHKVVLQKILIADPNKRYPVCIDGKRACPPEDCGGTDGYRNLLKIIKNKKHPEYTGMTNWLKTAHGYTDFDPVKFQPETINFRPVEQRKYTFNNPAEANFFDCIQM